jgi:hypothetical protein
MNFQFPFMPNNHPFVDALLKAIQGFPGCANVEGFVVAVGPCPYCNDLFDDIQTAIVGRISGDADLLTSNAKSDVESFFRECEEKNYQTISYVGAVGNHVSLNERVWAVKGHVDDEMNRAIALCYGVMQTFQLVADPDDALRMITNGESVSFNADLLGRWQEEVISFLDQIPAGEGKILAELIPTVVNLCWLSVLDLK